MSQRYSKRRRAYWEGAHAMPPEYVFLTRASERLRGLLFRKPDGLVRVLVPCGAVHTIGMAHELDIAFLDEEGTVLAAHRRVGKRRRLRCRGARMTLERFADEKPWFAAGDRVSLTAVSRQVSKGKENG